MTLGYKEFFWKCIFTLSKYSVTKFLGRFAQASNFVTECLPKETIEFKFHMKSPYDRLGKFIPTVLVIWPRWPPRPYMVKTLLNIFFSGTKRPMALVLGMWHWGYGPYQICTNDEYRLTLIYFMAKSNLIPTAFIWDKSWNVHFSITV